MSNELTTVANQMQNAFKDLNAAFDTEAGTELAIIPPREIVVQPVIEDRPVGQEERTNDIAVVRETLHRVMGKSEDALDLILALARQSEHPRAFEVVGQMVKNVSDVASQIVDLHKKVKDIEKPVESARDAALNGGNFIESQTNVVFTGTPQEVLAALKQKREMKDVTDVDAE